jgi:hypothetical protein
MLELPVEASLNRRDPRLPTDSFVVELELELDEIAAAPLSLLSFASFSIVVVDEMPCRARFAATAALHELCFSCIS